MSKFRKELVDAGILQKGLFELRGDQVTDTKVEFDIVLENPPLLKKTARFLARMIHNAFPSINTIITVANGANALAEPVTFAMKRLRQPVTPIVTAKDSKIIYFEPDEYHKLFGTDAVIIDDVLTRATNVTFVGGLAENAGARVHGAGVVWRRDMSSELVLPRHPDPLPIHALIEEEIPAWNKSRQTT